jgi:AraC family transcriptional regulator of arabinose operon
LEDPERTHVRQRLTDAHRLSAHGGPFDQMIAMAVLEEVLIRCRRHAEQADEGGLDPRVRQATDYIHQRLPAPISVDELAAAVGLSASRLSHLFQGELGIPPRASIERQRLNRARQLLTHSLLSVQAVAAEVGFDSEFYFSNRFKKLTGTSPSEYRRGSRPH